MLTLGAFINMTGDAMLIVDPRTLTIRYASPRAIDLIGPILGEKDIAVSRVFLNHDGRLDAFVRDALTVSEPIMSSVSVLPEGRVLSAKGRRLAVQDSAAQVLVLLEAEPELSSRFRLLSEKIDELRAEVSRRVTAERGLSENIISLQRSVSVIKQLSELDISGGDYLDMAAVAIGGSLKSHGTVVISAVLGKLRVMAATGIFEEAYEGHPYLDLSFTDFIQSSSDRNGRWNELLLSSLKRSGTRHVELANGLLVPLSVSGELRGALFCNLDESALKNASVRLEAEIVSEALGGLMARAEIEARLIHAQKLHAIGELTGGIAHDFNNILAVVLGNAELLLYELDSIDLDVAREIREAAMRGATLTSRLLSFARKQSLKLQLTDINTLLRDFDPLIRRTLREDINFELISAGGLWEAQIDRNQLENAVLNLAVSQRLV